jgi:hypothetical protein
MIAAGTTRLGGLVHRKRNPEFENSKIHRRQDETDIEITVSDCGTDDVDRPDDRLGCITGCRLAPSHDRTGLDRADAGYHALQDARLGHGAAAENRDCGLNEAAAGHCDQRKRTKTRAPLFAGTVPSDRQASKKATRRWTRRSPLSFHWPIKLGIRRIGTS